jgi:hypothetical protein
MTLAGSRPKGLAGGRPLERRVRRHLLLATQRAIFLSMSETTPALRVMIVNVCGSR